MRFIEDLDIGDTFFMMDNGEAVFKPLGKTFSDGKQLVRRLIRELERKEE